MRPHALLLLPLALLSPVLATTPPTILDAISNISNNTLSLNSSITTFRSESGNPLQLLPIVIHSSSLLASIKSGTNTAKASANLTFDETVAVAGATQSLVSNVQSTLSNIIAAKPLFNRELVSPVIYLDLELDKQATDQFSEAVISKVPSALQGLAQQIVAPVDTAFDAALAAYKGQI
ncbi:hypothetical protein M430DRAFT_23384 [Amorphotheca resinae ATCC 22711]|jgi:hypothetical protein|uniref:Antigenic cell wall galactomannoprotein n=1 Tax=Amorphotheca resinae ATCC 22711 TaxID=857342 RepID=A0A2T3AP31_AMORE|nr:hypothetical protein M430DRAFT_23384 [Amorphotheca resinae ATCC 22711]PSS06686.1 hypothetical protein M430DRAFT_23384 [Amorphotheca resinae ATCC 22711]